MAAASASAAQNISMCTVLCDVSLFALMEQTDERATGPTYRIFHMPAWPVTKVAQKAKIEAMRNIVM